MKLILSIAFVIIGGWRASAQEEGGSSASRLPVGASLPQIVPASHPATPALSVGGEQYLYVVGALCGTGISTSSAGIKPTAGCGVGLTIVPLPIFVEFGLMGPQANRSSLSAYMSIDTSLPLLPTGRKCLPMGIVGYSRLFETGHAFDYGLALALPRGGKRASAGSSMRIELRDYWTFANPTQHNVVLRLGWMAEESD